MNERQIAIVCSLDVVERPAQFVPAILLWGRGFDVELTNRERRAPRLDTSVRPRPPVKRSCRHRLGSAIHDHRVVHGCRAQSVAQDGIDVARRAGIDQKRPSTYSQRQGECVRMRVTSVQETMRANVENRMARGRVEHGVTTLREQPGRDRGGERVVLEERRQQRKVSADHPEGLLRKLVWSQPWTTQQCCRKRK